MDISAIIKAVLTPHEDRPGTQLLEMKPGDQISGRVLKIANDGRVLMDLGSRRAFAQIGFPVKIGQRLQLQVVTTGSVLHLKAETGRGSKGIHPMPANPDFSGAINHEDQKRLVEILGRLAKGGHGVTTGDGTTANIRTTLQQLTTIFETIPMADSTQRISRWLKKAVENRGILFEKQLADSLEEISGRRGRSTEKTQTVLPARILITQNVKPQLLQVQHYLAHMGESDPVANQLNTRDIRFLQRSVDQLIGHIEQQQGRAVASWKEGDLQQVFIHSLDLPDHKKPVQLKVIYPRKGERKVENQQFRMAMLLDMDAIGLVRVDLAMTSRQLSIGFFVGNTGVQQLVQDHIQEVENALAGQFDVVQVNVSVSPKNIKQFHEDDSSRVATGRIDLTV